MTCAAIGVVFSNKLNDFIKLVASKVTIHIEGKDPYIFDYSFDINEVLDKPEYPGYITFEIYPDLEPNETVCYPLDALAIDEIRFYIKDETDIVIEDIGSRGYDGSLYMITICTTDTTKELINLYLIEQVDSRIYGFAQDKRLPKKSYPITLNFV
jgi:hypothetical protein